MTLVSPNRSSTSPPASASSHGTDAGAIASRSSRTPRRWLRGLTVAARKLWALCRREKLWAACMLVFVLTWTVELYLVQAITLVYPNAPGPRFEYWAPKIRFVMDLLFILGLTFWLRRRWRRVRVLPVFGHGFPAATPRSAAFWPREGACFMGAVPVRDVKQTWPVPHRYGPFAWHASQSTLRS